MIKKIVPKKRLRNRVQRKKSDITDETQLNAGSAWEFDYKGDKDATRLSRYYR